MLRNRDIQAKNATIKASNQKATAVRLTPRGVTSKGLSPMCAKSNTRTCSIDGCNRPHTARGWCKMHYYRWKRTGSTDIIQRTRSICEIEGCNEYVVGRGWCRKHYMRWVRHNDPLQKNVATRNVASPEERFWAKIEKDHSTGCWEWTAYISELGYGQFKAFGAMVRAHRFAYELLIGPIPEGLEIDHLCQNRGCVNPDHLEPVSHIENVRRGHMRRKLRMNRGDA